MCAYSWHCLSVKISFISSKSKWKSHNVLWVGGVAVDCEGIAGSSFPAVLICHSNEQAAVHGHQAIIFGYHANSEHHGMSLYWEIYPGSITMLENETNAGHYLNAGFFLWVILKCKLSFLQGMTLWVENWYIQSVFFVVFFVFFSAAYSKLSCCFFFLFFLLFTKGNYIKWISWRGSGCSAL